MEGEKITMELQHFGNHYLKLRNRAIYTLWDIIGNIKRSHGIESTHLVLLTGSSSFVESKDYEQLVNSLAPTGSSNILSVLVEGEPSPQLITFLIEESINRFGAKACKEKKVVVVSIGGGSTIDAGKALSAMLPLVDENEPLPNVKDYLEGVGSKKPEGLTVPFIACPTTAGTGSEATKNAVISEAGEGGFKKSLRHDNYIPIAAVIDPSLAITCPRSVTAASGLDALTQLIESWTSPTLTPFMSTLIPGAIKSFADNFLKVLDKGNDYSTREGLAYASYVSGLALSNCGLGSVHALASTIGGQFSIPHGVICGNLIKSGAEINIKKLNDNKQSLLYNPAPMNAYAKAGFILAGANIPDHLPLSESKIAAGTELLLETLQSFLEIAELPSLSSAGLEEKHISAIAANSKTVTNPVGLTKEDYENILRNVL
jgi:alcohol dehydrogenase class IV